MRARHQRRGGRLHPGARTGRPVAARAVPLDGRRRGLRGGRHPDRLHDPVDLQALRLRARAGRARPGRGARRGRRRAVRRGVRRALAGAGVGAAAQPDDQRRRARRAHPGRRAGDPVRADPGRAVGVRRPPARGGRGGVPLRDRDRVPQLRHRQHAAQPRHDPRAARAGRRRLHPAVRGPGHRPRPRADGRDPRQRRHQPAHRGAGGRRGRRPADAERDGHLGDVRRRRRLDLDRRLPRQERRLRRDHRRAARPARDLGVLTAARPPRPQRARRSRRAAGSPATWACT